MNTTPGGINYLGQLTDSITNLTTQNGAALSNFGMILLTFIATIILIGIAVRMSSWSAHFGGNRPVSMDELKTFLFRFLFCLVIEHYWINNLPGSSFGFNRMFAYVAAQISQILDQKSLDQLLTQLRIAAHDTQVPTGINILEQLCYYGVEGIMGIASAILFLVNASAFIFYAVAALFGPIMIPLYLTETFRGKFIHFIEVLVSLAMIRAVGAAFVFVWSQFLIGFLNQTFQGNYSIGNWIANLVPFMMVFVAFILNLIMVPSLTQMIFGGGAGLVGKIGEMAERAAFYK